MSAEDHLGIQFSMHQPDDLTTRFDAHDSTTGKNVGYASTVDIPGEPAYLDGLRVADDYQGRGIGHRLVRQVTEHYSGRTINLKASPFGNEPMNTEQLTDFYGKHGFKPRKDGGMTRRAR